MTVTGPIFSNLRLYDKLFVKISHMEFYENSTDS